MTTERAIDHLQDAYVSLQLSCDDSDELREALKAISAAEAAVERLAEMSPEPSEYELARQANDVERARDAVLYLQREHP